MIPVTVTWKLPETVELSERVAMTVPPASRFMVPLIGVIPVVNPAGAFMVNDTVPEKPFRLVTVILQRTVCEVSG